jgi:hypothetical protein
MAKPTRDDADLMLQLVRAWPAEATDWTWGDEFDPDYEKFAAKYTEGSEQFAYVHAVLNWYETIGTLHKHGLLNEDLLFDWLAIDMVWGRMKSHALAWRAQMGNAHIYENFEAMAKAQREWVVSDERSAA